MKKNKIKRKWDNVTERWADFVRSGKDYYREELNNPATFKLMGNIKGKRILDLACGEGYNSRIMSQKGAKVVGIDFSEKMIGMAIQKEKKEKLGIDYQVADAGNLSIFKDETFDIVVCFMTFQDIQYYPAAFKEVHRVLKKNGRFVFSLPHPCFEATCTQKRENNYFPNFSYIVQWKMKRLKQHFKTISFHRTLTDYANALHEAKFLISRLKEPKLTKKSALRHPIMKQHLKVPQSIIIEAVKR